MIIGMSISERCSEISAKIRHLLGSDFTKKFLQSILSSYMY